jgi:hypothetical protein
MTDDDDLRGNRASSLTPLDVLHVERAFSAQPTLSNVLGAGARIHEMPLPEALAHAADPDLIWASDATTDSVHLLRQQFPQARLLATVPRGTGSPSVLALLAAGADLVLHDEGILLAAAALEAMARRLPGRGSSPPDPSDRGQRPTHEGPLLTSR